jgi:hypothetical protein
LIGAIKVQENNPPIVGTTVSQVNGRRRFPITHRINQDTESPSELRFLTLTRNNASQALAFPSRPKQRAGQNHERLVEEARDNGGGFTSGGGLLQFFRQDRPGLVENTN